jgi:hypothetical protein
MRDIILDKLREMMKPAKVKKTKPFSPSKKDIEAHGNEIQRREDAREPSDRDAEVDQMAKDYGYGKKEEAIAFPKTTTRGKAARATAADTLRDVKSRMQKSGLAKKPGDAAKLTKQFSKENYKQRESLALILANKIEELKQSTVDSAAKKRVAQVRSKDFSGKETPVYKGGTGGTDKPEQIGTRSGAGKGVLGKRLSTLYKGKTTPKTTKREESTNLKDRMVGMLADKINEARGDAIQKLGIPLTHITGSDGPVVPPRGHRVAKRLADRAKERKARDKELATRPPTPNYVRPTRRSMGDNTYRGDSD